MNIHHGHPTGSAWSSRTTSKAPTPLIGLCLDPGSMLAFERVLFFWSGDLSWNDFSGKFLPASNATRSNTHDRYDETSANRWDEREPLAPNDIYLAIYDYVKGETEEFLPS